MPTLRPSRPDLRVPMPGPGPKRYLAAAGEELEIDAHWRRALARGDVVEVAALAEDPPRVAGSPEKPRSNTARGGARPS